MEQLRLDIINHYMLIKVLMFDEDHESLHKLILGGLYIFFFSYYILLFVLHTQLLDLIKLALKTINLEGSIYIDSLCHPIHILQVFENLQLRGSF